MGEGGDGGLKAALEAARLAEVAQVAAENLAEKQPSDHHLTFTHIG